MSFKLFLEEQVESIRWTMGSSEFDKQVLKPFQKKVDTAIKKAKGKWNGQAYSFATPEQQAVGQSIMDELKAEWEKLKIEDTHTHDHNYVDAFFKHQDKVDKSFK